MATKALNSEPALSVLVFEPEESGFIDQESTLGSLVHTLSLPNFRFDFTPEEKKQAIHKLSPDVVIVPFSTHTVFADLFSNLKLVSSAEVTFVVLITQENSARALELYNKYDIDHVLVGPLTQDNLAAYLQEEGKHKESRKKLEQQCMDASQEAKSAIEAAYEISLTMQFLDWLQPCSGYQEVADAIFKLGQLLKVDMAVQIYDEFDTYLFSLNSLDESLKHVLNDALAGEVRLVSNERIMMARMDYLVIMVTDVPSLNSLKMERLKDILVQAASLAEAKVRTLMVNSLIQAQHDNVSTTLTLLRRLTTDTQENTRKIMEHLAQELKVAALTLDISEEQEDKLLQLSQRACDSLENLYQSNDAIESHFFDLLSSLTKVSEITQEQKSEKR